MKNRDEDNVEITIKQDFLRDFYKIEGFYVKSGINELPGTEGNKAFKHPFHRLNR